MTSSPCSSFRLSSSDEAKKCDSSHLEAAPSILVSDGAGSGVSSAVQSSSSTSTSQSWYPPTKASLGRSTGQDLDKNAASSGQNPPPWREKPPPQFHFVGDNDDNGESGAEYDRGWYSDVAAGPGQDYHVGGTFYDSDLDGDEDLEKPLVPQPPIYGAEPSGAMSSKPPDCVLHNAPVSAPGDHSHLKDDSSSNATVAVDDQEYAYRMVASPWCSPRVVPRPAVGAHSASADRCCRFHQRRGWRHQTERRPPGDERLLAATLARAAPPEPRPNRT